MNGLDLSPVNLSIIGAILALVFGPRVYGALKAGSVSLPTMQAWLRGNPSGITLDPHDEAEVAAFRGLQQVDHCLAQNGVGVDERRSFAEPVIANLIDYKEPPTSAVSPAVVPVAPVPQVVTHSLDSNLSTIMQALLAALQTSAKAGA